MAHGMVEKATDEKALIAERLALLAEQLHEASFELKVMVAEMRHEQGGPE